MIAGVGGRHDSEYKRAEELQAQGHKIEICAANKIFTIDEMVDVDEKFIAQERPKAEFNKVICFTKGLPLPKENAIQLARRKGYEVRNIVSNDVDYLIVGIGSEKDPEYKRAKALQSEGYKINFETADIIFTMDEMADAAS